LSPYLDRLIRDGRYDLARQTWLGTLPAALPANEARPFNGDFDLPIDGLPFNWRVTTIAGAEIDIVPSLANGQRPALRVQFSGRRVSFANVAQLLLLPPGSYTLAGKVKAEELDTVRGLWWRVFCADDAKNTLAHTELVSGSLPWTDFAVDFQVPDKNCRAQWLQLELPARIPSETRIEGQIWYQGLRISQKTASGIPPTATGASR
jgi:hypothetical protein